MENFNLSESLKFRKVRETGPRFRILFGKYELITLDNFKK